jgi:hypothetical protein
VLKFALAVKAALLGAFFVFPGFRTAQMHWDALQAFGESRVMQVLLHVNYVAPFFLVLAWVRPLARDYFTDRIWPGMDGPL